MAESKASIPHDDFVAKVVKDPKQPPDTILLTGFLGKSSEEGHTRLHFDPELKNYVEIPNDAILHAQQIPPEHSSLGGSYVWIKSDADLIHGKVGPSRTKAKFFEGPIAAGAGAAAGVAAGGPLPPSPFNCPTHAPLLCPHTVQMPCITPVPHCVPSPLPHCLPPPPTPLCTHVFTQCATPLHGCPPITQVTECPTPLHGCPPLTPQCPTHITQCGCPSVPPAFCPPTPLHPACPPTPPVLCPTPSVHPAACNTPLHGCPTPPLLCPTPSINVVNCPPHLTQNPAQCPVASPAPACGGFPGGPGGPVEQAAFAGQAALLPTSPAICQFFTPACPVTPFHGCPPHTLVHGCPTPLFGCPTPHPTPFCPSPFCPTRICHSVAIPCITVPGCPFPTPGCPFNPGGGGGINQ